MVQKAFTLLEIIATVVIVAILATIALPVFSNIIEDSKTRVCVTNVKTLKQAVEIYIMERDVVPGSLSQLTPRQLQKAYAAVLRERGGWKINVARAIVDLCQQGLAFAQGPASFGMPHLRCPKDNTPEGISYGLNQNLAGQSSIQYRNTKTNVPGTILVAEADSVDFIPGSVLVNTFDRYHIHYSGISKVSFLVGASVDGNVGIGIGSPGSPPTFYFDPAVVRSHMGKITE